MKIRIHYAAAYLTIGLLGFGLLQASDPRETHGTGPTQQELQQSPTVFPAMYQLTKIWVSYNDGKDDIGIYTKKLDNYLEKLDLAALTELNHFIEQEMEKTSLSIALHKAVTSHLGVAKAKSVGTEDVTTIVVSSKQPQDPGTRPAQEEQGKKLSDQDLKTLTELGRKLATMTKRYNFSQEKFRQVLSRVIQSLVLQNLTAGIGEFKALVEELKKAHLEWKKQDVYMPQVDISWQEITSLPELITQIGRLTDLFAFAYIAAAPKMEYPKEAPKIKFPPKQQGTGIISPEKSCFAHQQQRSQQDLAAMQAYFSKAGTVQMFAVFDGHANAKGTEVNKIAKQLKAIIEDMNHKLYGKLCPAAELLAFDKIVTPTEQDKKKLEEAITKSFMSVNDELKKEFGRGGSGSCATITFITPSHIIVANVGDSRTCIAFKDGTVWVTKDHKPSNPEEQKRIKAAGGFVEYGRVGGRLAVARSFGDYFAKGVVPLPDVTIFERSPKDPNKKPELIVQACDGVWESVDLMKGGVTQYVTDIQQRVNKGEKIIAGMCTDLAKKAAKKSNDDITVLLVDVR